LLDLERGSVLDVGCGSGVLAIAAAKLGFTPVLAIDLDPQAVEATARNAQVNEVELDVRLADAVDEPLPHADVTVANVTLAVAEEVGGRAPSPLYISSGYLVSEQPLLGGHEHVARRDAEGWAADLHRRI